MLVFFISKAIIGASLYTC